MKHTNFNSFKFLKTIYSTDLILMLILMYFNEIVNNPVYIYIFIQGKIK